jgi:excisionase family DNA binding protein
MTSGKPEREAAVLSTFEAAEYLGVPRQTLAAWRSKAVRQGPVFVKVGRAVKYRRVDLDAWLQTRRVDPTRGK